MMKNARKFPARLGTVAMWAAALFADASAAPSPESGSAAPRVERVVLFERSLTGGHIAARRHLREALLRLASSHGFQLQVTSDAADLNDKNLSTAQVLVLGNGDGDVVPAGAARAAVEKFVREDGKGLLVVHAGAAFLREWSFLAEGVGRQYDHHAPSITRASVYLDTGTAAEPASGAGGAIAQRVLEGLPERAELVEEFYGFASSPRGLEGVTVLLALDESSAHPPLETRMGDHPLVWVRRMGRGQVLTHTLGHHRGAFTAADSLGQRLLANEIAYLSRNDCAGLCKAASPSAPADFGSTQPEIRILKQTLSVRVPGEGVYRVRVLDVAGKSVFARSVKDAAWVQAEGLRAGSYTVQVESAEGKVFRRRVVVR